MKLTRPASERNCAALKAYADQKRSAKKRGVPFLLTSAEWQWLWWQSGKWNQRGKLAHQYVMARKGDVGPYAVGNVFFQTVSENAREGNLGRKTQYRQEPCEKCGTLVPANIAWRHARKCLGSASLPDER